MTPTFSSCSGLRRSDGFTLVELLTVIVIISLLIVITAGGIGNVHRSQQLTAAGGAVRDQLVLARQLAITQGRVVVVSLCETSDEAGVKRFNTVYISREERNGTLTRLTPPTRFPEGIAIAREETWSSIMSLPESGLSLPSGIARSREVRFTSSGRASLPSGSKWFLTLFNEAGSSNPGSQFVTLLVDPVTGRVFSYQP